MIWIKSCSAFRTKFLLRRVCAPDHPGSMTRRMRCRDVLSIGKQTRTCRWEKAPRSSSSLRPSGTDQLEIDVAPWGEGELKINGMEVARITEAKDRRHAFAYLKRAAERHIRGEPIDRPLADAAASPRSR